MGIRRLVPLKPHSNGFFGRQFETFEHGFMLETMISVKCGSKLQQDNGKRSLVGEAAYNLSVRILHYGNDIEEPLKYKSSVPYAEDCWSKDVILYTLDIGGTRVSVGLFGTGKRLKAPEVIETIQTTNRRAQVAWVSSKRVVLKGLDGKRLQRPTVYMPRFLLVAANPAPLK